MKKNTIRKAARAAGIVLIAAAVIMTVYNIYCEIQAERISDGVLGKFEEAVPETQETEAQTPEENIPKNRKKAAETAAPDPDRRMPEVEIDGDMYIGVISIPDIELSLPVMTGWNYTLLKKAPCRYSGSVYKDNMCICAHNYKKHFGPIGRLPIGTKVQFTDVEGNLYEYAVDSIEQIQPDNLEYMAQTGGLTLFTCTLGGSFRIAVRCKKL